MRYTLDESLPVTDWDIYTKPFNLNKSGILAVRAFKEDYSASDMTYSVNERVPQRNGVYYKYYTGSWRKLPDLLTQTPARTGRVDQFRLEKVGTRKTDFALLMIGYVEIEKAGMYTFYCGSNDGSALYMDNTLLIDNDGHHGFVELSEEMYLSEGIHQVEVRYFQLGGGQSLKVSWQGEGFEKRELSQDDLKVF